MTVDDELNRWQKYSYGECFGQRITFTALSFALGCNELIFNPLIEWWRKGPIAKQLRIFVWSSAPVHYKFAMMACKVFDFPAFYWLTRTPRHVFVL